ncbi:MAG: YdcF family protein [Flavobacteriales bacterium]|nr:YdcF family protein [Flavobacteriales bacterium]MBP9079226.1 YdcF family protein [Flavobacteriales bacterium]
MRRTLPARLLRMLLAAAMAGLVVWMLHVPLLRAIGNFLITEDPPNRVDAVFVLGGSVYDRGMEAARIHQQGLSPRFIFTGAPVPTALKALGIDSTEAECTRNTAVMAGIPLAHTTALNKGTSTFEEAVALLDHARSHGLDTVMVISNRFHLRRIGMVFRPRFEQAGITVLLHGAPSPDINEAFWWASEEGLVMLNNEYLKLGYYWLRY